MAWRVARSLDMLLSQLNAMYPARSKDSDGSIGDAAHASRDSDHNPWYGPGIVTARDFTHDPDGGIDGNDLARWLTTSGDRRIKYVIWNRHIWEPGTGWEDYYGTNPHDHHVHVSVVASPACDDTTAWRLGAAGNEDVMNPAQYAVLVETQRRVSNTLAVATETQRRVTAYHAAESAALDALAQLVAKGTNGLTAAQVSAAVTAATTAAVTKALAENVVHVDVDVAGA